MDAVTRHHWGAGGAQRQRNVPTPRPPLLPVPVPQIFFPLRAWDDWLPKHEWELISISKGWRRQGRNPKICAKTPVASPGTGNSPFKAWFGEGATLHEVLPLPCMTLCSTPGVAGHEETHQDPKAEYFGPL